MSGAPVLCTVYGSSRVDGMYLYLLRGADPAELPEALMQRFGEPREVMTLPLSPSRTLARVDVQAVLAALADPGWFLQMPPQPGAPDPEVADVSA